VHRRKLRRRELRRLRQRLHGADGVRRGRLHVTKARGRAKPPAHGTPRSARGTTCAKESRLNTTVSRRETEPWSAPGQTWWTRARPSRRR
jgi:hypothetical protein